MMSKKMCTLIMDGHASLITNEATIFGSNNRLEILTLLAHCSHKLQPLDVAIFHPFQVNLAKDKIDRMKRNLLWAQGSTIKGTLAEMASKI